MEAVTVLLAASESCLDGGPRVPELRFESRRN